MVPVGGTGLVLNKIASFILLLIAWDQTMLITQNTFVAFSRLFH